MTPKEFAKKIIASINPGTADISGIGDGTIKGAISEQNKNITINSTAGYVDVINPNTDCVSLLGSAYIVKMGTIAFFRMYFELTMEIPVGVALIAPVTYDFRPKTDLNNLAIDLVNANGIGVVNWKSDGVLYSNVTMIKGSYKVDIPYYTN